MLVCLSWASFSIGSVPQPHLTLATFLGLPSEIQHKDVLKRAGASSGFSPAWGRDTLTHPQWYLRGLFSFGSDAPKPWSESRQRVGSIILHKELVDTGGWREYKREDPGEGWSSLSDTAGCCNLGGKEPIRDSLCGMTRGLLLFNFNLSAVGQYDLFPAKNLDTPVQLLWWRHEE